MGACQNLQQQVDDVLSGARADEAGGASGQAAGPSPGLSNQPQDELASSQAPTSSTDNGVSALIHPDLLCCFIMAQPQLMMHVC